MASATYENILRELKDLSPDELRQLQNVLTIQIAQPSQDESPLVAFLRAAGPLDPSIASSMEQVIEADGEHIDMRDW